MYFPHYCIYLCILNLGVYNYIFTFEIHNYLAIDIVIYKLEIKKHFLKCTNI